MRSIVLALFMGLALTANTQSMTFDSLCNHLNMEQGDVEIKVPGWLLRMGVSIAAQDDEIGMTLQALKKGLKKAHIVVMNNKDIPRHTYNRMLNEFRGDGFEEYVAVRDGASRVQIMLKEKKECIRNMLIMVHDECGEFVAVDLKTRITYDELEDMLASVDVDMN